MILFNKTRSFTRRGLDPTLDEDPLLRFHPKSGFRYRDGKLKPGLARSCRKPIAIGPFKFHQFFFSFTLRALFGPLNYGFVS